MLILESGGGIVLILEKGGLVLVLERAGGWLVLILEKGGWVASARLLYQYLSHSSLVEWACYDPL